MSEQEAFPIAGSPIFITLLDGQEIKAWTKFVLNWHEVGHPTENHVFDLNEIKSWRYDEGKIAEIMSKEVSDE